MMKKNLFALTCILALNACAQEQKGFDPVSWQAPYDLSLDGWGIERFPMPIDFAPAIPYEGVEDVRFSSGTSRASIP